MVRTDQHVLAIKVTQVESPFRLNLTKIRRAFSKEGWPRENFPMRTYLKGIEKRFTSSWGIFSAGFPWWEDGGIREEGRSREGEDFSENKEVKEFSFEGDKGVGEGIEAVFGFWGEGGGRLMMVTWQGQGPPSRGEGVEMLEAIMVLPQESPELYARHLP